MQDELAIQVLSKIVREVKEVLQMDVSWNPMPGLKWGDGLPIPNEMGIDDEGDFCDYIQGIRLKLQSTVMDIETVLAGFPRKLDLHDTEVIVAALDQWGAEYGNQGETDEIIKLIVGRRLGLTDEEVL